jgi:uncharacterized peroxidase-related enzyme
MYQRQASQTGYVPNYAKVFCHRPEIMGLWGDLLRGIRRNVEPERFELVTLAAAHALRNSYCSLAHGKALTKFRPEQAVRSVVDSEGAETLTETERAIVRFARKVALNAAGVTAEDVGTLKAQGLTDPEIFDLVAVVAARAFFTRILDGLGAMPDAAYGELDDSLRAVLTVGRPVAHGSDNGRELSPRASPAHSGESPPA